MKKHLLISFAALGFCLSAPAADLITQWNFNSDPWDGSATTGTLVPSIGTGTAAIVGPVTPTYNPGSLGDPLGGDANNSAWRTSNFPAQGEGNKTCGVQFNISTVGHENITLSWDQANSAAANKYYRVQYSVDNGATWVDKDVVINGQTTGNVWNTPIATISFASVPAASDNPNLGVRIVSELQSTAVGGAPAYVAVAGGTYSTTAFLRLDMVTFSGDVLSGEVNILTDPASQVVAVGQPASFEVTAGGGTTAITYQWRTNEIAILNATNSIYSIASAQHIHEGTYDVVVANGVNSRTSQVATLTVRDPLNLAWTGVNGAYWDTNLVSWINTNSGLEAAYSGGDHVLFDSRGASAITVSLAGSLKPSSVTVDADFDYTFRSDTDGKIAGTAGLVKRGTGTLVLNTDNTYSGPTLIEAGLVQLGAADTHGSLGSGPITNHGGIVFNRSDSLSLANDMVSTGGITNLGKQVILSGANTYSGPIVLLAGILGLSGNQAIQSSEIVVAASSATGVNGATKLTLANGLVIGPDTTVRLTGTMGAPDVRCAFYSTGGTNVCNGPVVLEGSGNNGIGADDSAELRLNGTVSGSGFAGSVSLRGVGAGVANGNINLPGGVVHKTDAGTWTVNSTGNSWAFTSLAVGTLRIGAPDALPTSLGMSIGQNNAVARLDLAGFNQQIGSLADGGGTEIITNSSATADCTLTIGSGVFSGSIGDSASGGKLGVTLNGTAFTLGGANTYRGNTTIAAGTLYLSGAGDIANSPVINLAGGALDVTARNDGALPLNSGQILKGNGTISVTGNLVNNGTIELKVNKTGGVVTHDALAVTGQLSLGGTLKLVLTGEALTSTDVLPVFAGGSLAGGVPTIDPAVPAPGATWDTSTLLTDGKLRIRGSAMFVRPVLSGTTLTLGGSGGEPFTTFTIITSTNIAAPAENWTTVETGSFDGSGNFSVATQVTLGQPRQFYRLKMP